MKVAVVGGGISGLTAVWLLNEHSEHDVELFEANGYVGGHTNTVMFQPSTGPPCAVDTGFIVFNKLTYPNLLKFLKILKIDHIPSNMSFSVKREFGPSYEWSGNGIGSLFNGISCWTEWVSQFQLLWDLVRFNWLSVDVLSGPEGDLTIQEYLSRHGYSDSFKRNYLLPMIASIWSTPANKTAMFFPMKTLIRFMANHHLLQVLNQPQWLTIKNGAKTYVDRILSTLEPTKCFKSTPVESISIDLASRKIFLNILNSGATHGPYDQVIFASHADQTTRILRQSDCWEMLAAELEILSQFKFNQNEAVLHNDTSLMPRRKEIWTSWNYIITDSTDKLDPPTQKSTGSLKQSQSIDQPVAETTVSLTYWMNLLQSIPESTCGPVLVTLNPPREINPKFVFGRWKYDHPLYTLESVNSQKKISQLQTKNGLSFIGAWTNYGFHEDGLTSALKLLILEKPEVFNVRSPFDDVIVRDERIRPAGLITRVVLGLLQIYIQIVISVVLMGKNLIVTLRKLRPSA